jgi:hypothetical protein
MYVFFMGLSVERIENRHFDVETHVMIIETLLLFAEHMTLGDIKLPYCKMS